MQGKGRPESLAGTRFGKLVAIDYIKGTPPKYKASWRCICDCGNEKVAKAENLKRGKTKSCGCDRHANRLAQVTKHGHTRAANGRMTGTYRSWHAMRQRCQNKNTKQYMDYGGRGITVCDRWNYFENFLADMGERPEGLTLDRYPDVNGNYEPGNCRWATRAQQTANRRAKVKNMDAIPLVAAAERVLRADNDNMPDAIAALRSAVNTFNSRAA